MKKHIGSSFDGWLEKEGILEEVASVAIKRVVERQITAVPENQVPRCIAQGNHESASK